MSAFQIIDNDTVTLTARGNEYTVIRMAGRFRVYCVNASSKAYRNGFPAGRAFDTLADVEQAYKGLQGVVAVFPQSDVISIVVLPGQTFRGVHHFAEAGFDVSRNWATQLVRSGVARYADPKIKP